MNKNGNSGCLLIYLLGIFVFLLLGAGFGTALLWPIGLLIGGMFAYWAILGSSRKK